MIYVVIWVLCGFAAAAIAQGKGNAGFAAFLAGLFLGPIGVIIAAVMPANPAGQAQRALSGGTAKKCPQCAELVQPDAKVCRYCQYVFPRPAPATQAVAQPEPTDSAPLAAPLAAKPAPRGEIGLWFAVIAVVAALIGLGWFAIGRLSAPPTPTFQVLPTALAVEPGVVARGTLLFTSPNVEGDLYVCPTDRFEVIAQQEVAGVLWDEVRITALGDETCSTVFPHVSLADIRWLRDSDVRAP